MPISIEGIGNESIVCQLSTVEVTEPDSVASDVEFAGHALLQGL
jgi:hypothetical protein